MEASYTVIVWQLAEDFGFSCSDDHLQARSSEQRKRGTPLSQAGKSNPARSNGGRPIQIRTALIVFIIPALLYRPVTIMMDAVQ